MKHNKMKRTAQEKMLLALSFGTSVGILPFAIYRAYQQEWYVALLDMLVVIGMALIFIFVYKTRKVKASGYILIFVAIFGNIVSFYLKGINQVYWIFPGMLASYYIINPLRGMFLNFILLCLYLPGLINTLEVVNLATILATIIITNIIAFVFASGLRKQAIVLKQLASEDYLTKSGNRRALAQKMEQMHKFLQNHDKTASIVLLDLDHFKRVNDSHGHIKGDEVLVQLSQLLKQHYKNEESIFRYGGEEFLVVCPNTDADKAEIIANAFKELVKHEIVIDQLQQTISIGISEYVKEETIEEWFHRVDLALYQAKNSGRDTVIKV